jgi:hypothetical protein
MNQKLGERRELARQVRKRLAAYLYWLEACGRDEAKAHRVLLAARGELGRLADLDAAASGIGGEDADGRLEIGRLAGQLDESARLLSEAGARLQAGTRTLTVLATLRRSWEDQAAHAADTAAGVLRSCATQLREAVAGAHAPIRLTAAGPARDAAPGSPHEQQRPLENDEAGGLDYEAGHRVALARELTYAAGCPLRDRYGFAAADQDVLFVVDAVFRAPDDARARFVIGSANGDQIELAMACDTITDEAYELAIVRALRPLAEQRRDTATRRLL